MEIVTPEKVQAYFAIALASLGMAPFSSEPQRALYLHPEQERINPEYYDELTRVLRRLEAGSLLVGAMGTYVNELPGNGCAVLKGLTGVETGQFMTPSELLPEIQRRHPEINTVKGIVVIRSLALGKNGLGNPLRQDMIRELMAEVSAQVHVW